MKSCGIVSAAFFLLLFISTDNVALTEQLSANEEQLDQMRDWLRERDAQRNLGGSYDNPNPREATENQADIHEGYSPYKPLLRRHARYYRDKHYGRHKVGRHSHQFKRYRSGIRGETLGKRHSYKFKAKSRPIRFQQHAYSRQIGKLSRPHAHVGSRSVHKPVTHHRHFSTKGRH